MTAQDLGCGGVNGTAVLEAETKAAAGGIPTVLAFNVVLLALSLLVFFACDACAESGTCGRTRRRRKHVPAGAASGSSSAAALGGQGLEAPLLAVTPGGGVDDYSAVDGDIDGDALQVVARYGTCSALLDRIGEWPSRLGGFLRERIEEGVTGDPATGALPTKAVDVWLFLRFQRDAGWFFVILTVFGSLVLLPVNVKTGVHEHLDGAADADFSRTTVANIPPESPSLWAHVVFCWLFSAATLAFMALQSMRLGQFSPSGRFFPEAPSVFVVRGLPATATASRVLRWATSAGKWRVRSAIVVRDKRKVLNATEKWRSARDHRWRLEAEQAERKARTLPCCVRYLPGGPCCPYPNLMFCACRQPSLEQRIRTARGLEVRRRAAALKKLRHDAVRESSLRPGPRSHEARPGAGAGARAGAAPAGRRDDVLTQPSIANCVGRGFLTFDSVDDAAAFMAAANSSDGIAHLGDPRLGALLDVARWETEEAPDPDDIEWSHVLRSRTGRRLRKCGIHTLVAAVMLVFTTPFALLSSLQSLASEEMCRDASALVINIVEWVRGLDPTISNLLLAYWTTMQVVLLNVLLMLILYSIERYLQTQLTGTRREASILQLTLAYLVLNTIVLPSVVLTSAYYLFNELVKNRSQLLEALDSIFLADTSFFVNYLIQRALLAPAAQMWRPGERLYQAWESSRALKDPKTGERPAPEVWPFEFGQQYAVSLTVFSVGLVFSTMVPLALPCAALYFLVKHCVDKYHLTRVLADLYNPAAEARAQDRRQVASGPRAEGAEGAGGATDGGARGSDLASLGGRTLTRSASSDGTAHALRWVMGHVRARRVGEVGLGLLGAHFRGRIAKLATWDVFVVLLGYQFAMLLYFYSAGGPGQFVTVMILVVATVTLFIVWGRVDKRYNGKLHSGGVMGAVMTRWLDARAPALVRYLGLHVGRNDDAAKSADAETARAALPLMRSVSGDGVALVAPLPSMRHSYCVRRDATNHRSSWLYVASLMELLAGDLKTSQSEEGKGTAGGVAPSFGAVGGTTNAFDVAVPPKTDDESSVDARPEAGSMSTMRTTTTVSGESVPLRVALGGGHAGDEAPVAGYESDADSEDSEDDAPAHSGHGGGDESLTGAPPPQMLGGAGYQASSIWAVDLDAPPEADDVGEVREPVGSGASRDVAETGADEKGGV